MDAQYSVLGAMLISPEIAPGVIQATEETDFDGACRSVYRVIRELFLAGSPIDPVAVVGKLGKDYQPFLVQIMEIVPTAANWELYVKLCREQARVARVRSLAQEMSGIEDAGKLRTLAEQASGLMVDKPGLKIVTMDDAQRDFYARHQRKAEYLTWPVPDLDDVLFCEPGDLIVIGGYPSSGKSAWALQCAWHWAGGKKVGFFSLETSAAKLFDRQMAAVAQIGMDRLKRNELGATDWESMAVRSAEISRRKLELIPAAGMTPADVRAVTVMRGYEVIFVDYLQLLDGGSDGSRQEQVAGISIALHTLAQSLGVTVVALSQLSRPQDKSKSPELNSLRESGQIEQDADVVMLLHKPEKDNPAGNRELRIRKNKEGTCPTITLAFDGLHQTFAKGQPNTAAKLAADGRKAQRKKAADYMEQLPMDTKVPW